jgi:hypothetical protein
MPLASPTGAASPSDRDWLTFFRDLYLGFGPPDEIIRRCIRRAYRDFNRTWAKGPTLEDERTTARTAGEDVLAAALDELRNLNVDQRAFDAWHSRIRRALMGATQPAVRGAGLTLGQAQKWVNMSVKYVVGGRVMGLERFERVAHVPIDRILLEELRQRPQFAAVLTHLPDGAWSKLSNESAYEAFQVALRNLVAPSSPLSLEFSLWLASQRR